MVEAAGSSPVTQTREKPLDFGMFPESGGFCFGWEN
nr:MAG TPA: hypothetical protein [Caudoviricetes sp.]